MSDHLLSALCNKYCQERDSAMKELARVTEEQQSLRYELDEWQKSAVRVQKERNNLRARVAVLEKERERTTPIAKAACEEIDQLRARVAELEGMLDVASRQRDYNRTRLEQVEQRNAELVEKAQKFPWALAGKAKRLEQRNAELEATLRKLAEFVGHLHSLEREDGGTGGVDVADLAGLLLEVNDVLAESATPAKHPDTERLDWLERKHEESNGQHYLVECSITYNGNTGAPPLFPATRAAIDAARKQGGNQI